MQKRNACKLTHDSTLKSWTTLPVVLFWFGPPLPLAPPLSRAQLILENVTKDISPSPLPLGLIRSHLQSLHHPGVSISKPRRLVNARQSFANETDVDGRFVRSEGGGVVWVKEGEVEEVGVASVNVGDELTALR